MVGTAFQQHEIGDTDYSYWVLNLIPAILFEMA